MDYKVLYGAAANRGKGKIKAELIEGSASFLLDLLLHPGRKFVTPNNDIIQWYGLRFWQSAAVKVTIYRSWSWGYQEIYSKSFGEDPSLGELSEATAVITERLESITYCHTTQMVMIIEYTD